MVRPRTSDSRTYSCRAASLMSPQRRRKSAAASSSRGVSRTSRARSWACRITAASISPARVSPAGPMAASTSAVICSLDIGRRAASWLTGTSPLPLAALVGQDRAAYAALVLVNLDDPHPERGLGRAGGRRGGGRHLGDERPLGGGVVPLGDGDLDEWHGSS